MAEEQAKKEVEEQIRALRCESYVNHIFLALQFDEHGWAESDEADED